MADKKTLAAVLDFMTSKNRPFSANDVVTGLRGDQNKTGIQKALDTLVADGKLVDKANGKQHVYVIDQSKMPTMDETEMRGLEAEVTKAKQQLREKLENVRRLEQEYKLLSSAVTSEEAKTQLADINQQLSVANARLSQLKSSSGPVISAAEKEKVSGHYKSCVKEWRKRKAMVTDIANTILESYPKSKKEFFEEVGIDDDGDMKIPKI